MFTLLVPTTKNYSDKIKVILLCGAREERWTQETSKNQILSKKKKRERKKERNQSIKQASKPPFMDNGEVWQLPYIGQDTPGLGRWSCKPAIDVEIL